MERQPARPNQPPEPTKVQAIDKAPAPKALLETEFIYLKTDKKLEQIRFDEIVFVEALGDYLNMFLIDQYMVTHLTMTKLTDSLPVDRFVPINRSYLVQLRFIKTLEGNSIRTTTGHSLTIGPNYRHQVKEQIRQGLVS